MHSNAALLFSIYGVLLFPSLLDDFRIPWPIHSERPFQYLREWKQKAMGAYSLLSTQISARDDCFMEIRCVETENLSMFAQLIMKQFEHYAHVFVRTSIKTIHERIRNRHFHTQ